MNRYNYKEMTNEQLIMRAIMIILKSIGDDTEDKTMIANQLFERSIKVNKTTGELNNESINDR